MPSYALFSVNDTRHIGDFANSLSALGWGIICTSKPYEELKKLGHGVLSVNEFVGMGDNGYPFPPTLHPKIEQALTGNDPSCRIELVYNITYGLEEGNDVGGHTLLALAVKGERIPVYRMEDMIEVVDQMKKKSELSKEYQSKLIQQASGKILSHYSQIVREYQTNDSEILLSKKNRTLANGENPYQVPSFLYDLETDDPLALPEFRLLTENSPCFTNMADLDCVVETLGKLSMGFEKNKMTVPYITVAAKHGNACGIGVDWDSPSQSVDKALWGNPLAVWGGELIVNFPITSQIASQLISSEKREEALGKKNWMLDVIAAPSVEPEGENILRQRKNTKIFVNPSLKAPLPPVPSVSYRHVRGGVLKQPGFSFVLDLEKVQWEGRKFEGNEIDSAIIAWACSFTSNHGGNEVAIAAKGSLLGVGGGPSTVEAAEIALERGARYHKDSLDGSVFAADAFFPFEDAPKVLHKGGCKGGIVPAGGVREQEVKDFFNKNELNVAFLSGEVRGFCRH